jgi:hypothetical protein
MCNEHQGKQLKMAQEHEEEVRIRWGETADKLNAALDRADHYEERMKSALRSREGILRQFEKIANYHQATDHGCICGKRNCETLSIIDADWVNDHIGRMHRRDQAL